MKRLNQWKIKTQMLLSILTLTILAAIILSTANWMVSRTLIEDNYKKTYESNLKSFNSTIDYKLQTVNEIVRAEVFEDEFCEAIKEKNTNSSKYFSTTDTFSLNRMAVSLESQSTLIDGVFIFNNEGKYFQHFRGNRDASSYLKYYRNETITEADWYKEAQKKRGRECYFGYNVLLPEGDTDKVSLVKEIRELGTQKPIGMLVLSLNKNFLRTSLVGNSQDFKSDTLMIIDENSPNPQIPLVYRTGDPTESQKIIEYYQENGEEENSEYLFTSCVNSMTGWKVINGIAKSDLGRDSVYVANTMISVGALVILLFAFLSNIITKQINRPLHQLEEVLQQVRQGSRHIEEEFDDSEIGKIGNTLKETINNNIVLKERLLKMDLKEKESELLLLQAQINPHFLYNTLDSIYCQAMLKDEEGIASMVNNLSETFKISLNNGQQKIQVCEEMEYIRRYMEIQDVRYKGRFELLMEIEEEIMDLHIIKLILQPFVENAMYHGLEPSPGGGFIEIKGERMENDLYFTVSDNGIGMRNVEDIYKGFGVRNVEDRIKLFYGNEYGIEVTSTFGRGTKVNIHIPVMKEERDLG